MKKDYVVEVTVNKQGEVIQEDEFWKGESVEEAKSKATYLDSHITPQDHSYVEIRDYAEDIESDDCTCFDYDTIKF